MQPGEEVTAGQTVLELETDKAVVEVPSTVSGTVSEVKAKVGQKLKVGDLIFTIAATAGAGCARRDGRAHSEAAPAEAGER